MNVEPLMLSGAPEDGVQVEGLGIDLLLDETSTALFLPNDFGTGFTAHLSDTTGREVQMVFSRSETVTIRDWLNKVLREGTR